MTVQVNTVTGKIASSELGKTLMHEHFIFGYAGFHGDHTVGGFDYDAAMQVAVNVAERVQAHGVKTIVDPTPNDCGRNPEFLRDVSERTGLQIVCTTGYYYEEEGAPGYFKFRATLGSAVEEIYEMFMQEITVGIGKTGIQAGAIKVASSKNVITDYEQMFFKAAARAQKETGVPILTHTQEGTMGPEQAELLIAEGADPSKILIGHMCGNTDVSYHMRTLEKGVNIGFDRFGLQGLVGTPMDSMREAVLIGLIGLGYGDRILLAQDTVNYWLGRPFVIPDVLLPLLQNYHVTHVFENVVPVLRQAGIREEQIDQIFVQNPARVFEGRESNYN
jgi:phosphotriesterase-related protein